MLEFPTDPVFDAWLFCSFIVLATITLARAPSWHPKPTYPTSVIGQHESGDRNSEENMMLQDGHVSTKVYLYKPASSHYFLYIVENIATGQLAYSVLPLDGTGPRQPPKLESQMFYSLYFLI